MAPESEYTFAVFPYLKTTGPVKYRDLVVRSSEDPADLPSNAIQHLEIIRSLFYLRDGFRIKEMSYTFSKQGIETTAGARFIRQLLQLRALACFIYSSPHPVSAAPFLTYEHSSLYLFRPRVLSKYLIFEDYNVEEMTGITYPEVDERDELQGYEGQLNFTSPLWVTKGSRIHPPGSRMWLNISQDLDVDLNKLVRTSDLHRPIFSYFASGRGCESLQQRALVAISWYNRSLGMDTPDEVALVHLAVAFESLIGLESRENLSERLREAVDLLVGDIPRLGSWVVQFYKARSEILHEGQSRNLMFVASDNPQRNQKPSDLVYRSLVSYGRQVFQICLAAILTGASLADRTQIGPMLVTNAERLRRICELLSKGTEDASTRIVSVMELVREVEMYRFVPERDLKMELLIGCAKLMIGQYLATNPTESRNEINMMQSFSDAASGDHLGALSLLKDIESGFRGVGIAQPSAGDDIRNIVASLVHSVWQYTFMAYFRLERGPHADASDRDRGKDA